MVGFSFFTARKCDVDLLLLLLLWPTAAAVAANRLFEWLGLQSAEVGALSPAISEASSRERSCCQPIWSASMAAFSCCSRSICSSMRIFFCIDSTTRRSMSRMRCRTASGPEDAEDAVDLLVEAAEAVGLRTGTGECLAPVG